MRFAFLAALALALSACSYAVPITRVVHVHTTKYVPIPPSLLTPCQKAPIPSTATWGDLAQALASDEASLSACNGQLDAIKTIAPPAAT